jgi:hypothetical protein
LDDDLALWVFEIAVYRVSAEVWLDDVTGRVDRWVEAHLELSPEEERERERPRVTVIAQEIERPHGWQYNDVVAWVRLKADPDVIKAYAWDVQQNGSGGGSRLSRSRAVSESRSCSRYWWMRPTQVWTSTSGSVRS